MWQRFSERARKVVFYAQEEAQKFGEGYVSTEHLLLGLCRDSDSMAARVLEKLGVSPNRIRAEIEKQLPRGDSRPRQDMTLTPRGKRVIDLAYDEARNLNHNYIGSEHLLLGLIREGDGLAARVLQKLRVELEKARFEVVQLDGGTPRPEPPPGTSGLVPREQVLSFLNGACIRTHLLLTMIGNPEDGGGKLIRAACTGIGTLQWKLWQEMVQASRHSYDPNGAAVLDRLLARAQDEAGAGAVESQHVLLALFGEGETQFGKLLDEFGVSEAVIRDQMGGHPQG